MLDYEPLKVRSRMNDTLISKLKEEEVKCFLFEMIPTKAQGPDGFPLHFFYRKWDFVWG